jgi:NRPS condensation-like uncharacterized protein
MSSSTTSAASSSQSTPIDSDPSLGNLFPLPLAPFEKFLVLDDRPDCPITSFIELHFTRPMNHQALSGALHQTVHQHPLLASRLVDIDGEMHWQYDPHFVPKLRDPAIDPILSPSESIPSGQPSPRPINLRSEPGCRYWYQSDPNTGRARLTIQLHHAASDGVGLRRVLIDTLGAYAKRTTESNNVDINTEDINNDQSSRDVATADQQTRERRKRREQLDTTRLLSRGDFTDITSKPPKQVQSRWRKLANAYYFHFQRPQPLLGNANSPATTTPSRQSDTDDQPLRHYVFDRTTSERILSACRSGGVGVNDLALAILFRVCRQWNRLRGIDKPGKRIRLLMPVDMRGRSDMQMPATNRLSFSFLGRTHRQCDDWEVLLESVQTETQMIKDTRLHMDFLDGITALASKPKLLGRALRYSRNVSTSVLTYTGDITRGMKNYFPEEDGKRRVGDTFLENILIAPPARQNTNITLGVCINWGQICVSANWNRSAISADDCQQFLDLYAEAANQWLATVE